MAGQQLKVTIPVFAFLALYGMPCCLGCTNTYNFKPGNASLDGGMTYDSVEFPLSYVDPRSNYHLGLDRKWKQSEEILLANYKKSQSFKDLCDYGAALLHNGKTEESLEIFQKLILEHPDEYPIASNLGTAYELIGNNTEALKWIKRSLELHSGSHEGTEWLHIKILEAKIAMESDPNWMEKNSVLGIDFGSGAKPKLPASLSGDDSEQKKILQALRYQLKERVQFVKPTDFVVAQLLFDLSNLVAFKYNVNDAMEVCLLAMEYQGEGKGRMNKLLQKRLNFYSDTTSDSIFAKIRIHKLAFSLIGLFVLSMLTMALKFHLNDYREAKRKDRP